MNRGPQFSLKLLPWVIALLAASSAPAHAAPGSTPPPSHCLGKALAVATDGTGEAHRLQLALNNHIRQLPDGSYEVLLRMEDRTFRIEKVATAAEARTLAASIGEPVNIQKLIHDAQTHFTEVAGAIRAIGARMPGVKFITRIKAPDAIKQKLFLRVQKHGSRYHLSMLDDVAGARFVVSERKQISEINRGLRQLEGVEILQDDLIAYERGYRANHVTLRKKPDGYPMEVQIMTERTARWSAWDHDLVYKRPAGITDAYYAKLKEYDLAVIRYLNSLDDHRRDQAYPLPGAYGIRPEHTFPAQWLK